MSNKIALLLLFILIACKKNDQGLIKNEREKSSKLALPEDSSFSQDFEKLIKEYENEERDRWQQPNFILSFLGDLKGKKIADIGAGTGYFSFRLAQKADTVYAIDIEKRFLDYIEERKEGLSYGLGENVVTKLSSPDDPGLSHKVDIVFLANTYSYIEQRVRYFSKVRQLITPKGFICIVDFKNVKIPVTPTFGAKISPQKVMQELRSAGFKQFEVDSVSLPYQYILKGS